jgi:hypothetical protein
MLLSALTLSFACGDKDTDTGAEEADTDTDTDADADTDTDTDTDTGLQAELVWQGTATVDKGDSYSGTEEVVLISDRGDGDIICQYTYPVTATAAREDCENCDWAFDVVLGAASVKVDTSCADAGLDPAAVEGTTRAYGYDPEYFGHAELMMTDSGDGWAPADFANYDVETGDFSYFWPQGYINY